MMSPEPLGLFGIDNTNLNLAINLLILSLVVIWLALIYWTWSDARRRIDDDMLVATAVLAAFFPFIGTVVYTILRPPEYLEDVRERELEMKASELRLRHLTEQSCPRCQHPIERTFLRCPECQTRLKDPCQSCGRPVTESWMICPYCEAPLAARKEEARERARQTRRARSKQRVAKRTSRSGAGSERGTGKSRKPAQPEPASPSPSRSEQRPGASRSRSGGRPTGSGSAEQKQSGSAQTTPAQEDGTGSTSRRPRRAPASR